MERQPQMFPNNISRRVEIKNTCISLIENGLLKDLVSYLANNIHKKFDSTSIRNKEELVDLKSQIDGLKAIERSIEEMASGKTFV